MGRNCQVEWIWRRRQPTSNLYRDRVGVTLPESVLDIFFNYAIAALKNTRTDNGMGAAQKTLELTNVLLLSGRVNLKEAPADFKFVSRPSWGYEAWIRSRYIFPFRYRSMEKHSNWQWDGHCAKNTRTDKCSTAVRSSEFEGGDSRAQICIETGLGVRCPKPFSIYFDMLSTGYFFPSAIAPWKKHSNWQMELALRCAKKL